MHLIRNTDEQNVDYDGFEVKGGTRKTNANCDTMGSFIGGCKYSRTCDENVTYK